jgi:hypothetical protein
MKSTVDMKSGRKSYKKIIDLDLKLFCTLKIICKVIFRIYSYSPYTSGILGMIEDKTVIPKIDRI